MVFCVCLFIAAGLYAAGQKEAPKIETEKISGTVSFWTFLDPKDTGPRSVVQSKLVEEFEQKNGVKVDVIHKYWADIPNDFIRAVAGGVAPDVTRLSMPKSWRQMVAADTLGPISDYTTFTEADKKDWVLDWDVYSLNGKKYALPISYTFVALWSNPKHLQEVGEKIPKTWDELINVASKLTQKGYVGYVTSVSKATEVNSLFEFFDSAYYGLGKKPVDDKGFVTWGDSEEGVKVMELLKKLVDAGAIPKETLAWNVDDSHRGYMAGKVSMMNYGTMRVFTTRKGGQEVTVSAMPGWTADKPSPSYTSGWHLAMAKTSKNPRAAAEFIKYMTSPDGQIMNAKVAGEMPSRLSPYSDPWFSSSPEGKEMARWKELLNKVGVMMEFFDDWLPMRQALADAAQEIILRNAPIRETLKKHADNFNKQRK